MHALGREIKESFSPVSTVSQRKTLKLMGLRASCTVETLSPLNVDFPLFVDTSADAPISLMFGVKKKKKRGGRRQN